MFMYRTSRMTSFCLKAAGTDDNCQLSLGEIERGEKIISIEALLQIAKAIKVPIRAFFREV